MKFIISSVLLLATISVNAQKNANTVKAFTEKTAVVKLPQQISIIPEPVSLTQTDGQFILPENILIQATKLGETKANIDFLKEKIGNATGYRFTVTNIATDKATIKLLLNDKADQEIGKEGYKLTITPEHVTIVANNNHGLFYGIQSFLQLLPKEIESKSVVKNTIWHTPCVKITDFPRVGWRGMMFDVARHFFTKDEVKKFIDNMVRYKYNLLHLHLTDDEGWRIEIKGYPKLTEVGAWNVKREGPFGTFLPTTPDEPRDYGGFFTQADLKELVAYAKTKYVDIMPEVDVPGHSLAAVASYPELSCTDDAVNYKVRSGERIMDWSRGAPPTALVDNTLCPANEKVYQFLDTVIRQVAEIFPFEYIHMGGDEAPHNFWAKSPQVAALMRRENLKTMPEVQGYFERRVEKIVNNYGKKMMAWDEVLEGKIEQSTAIMNWRSTKYGKQAVQQKHQLVSSPAEFAYIDYMQADVITEPKIYASLRLNKTYEFDPIPEGVDASYVKGGQANLWAEQIFNFRQVEYMVFPRAMSLAEAMWSPKEKKNWKNFFAKTEEHFKRFDIADIKYAPSVYDPIFTVKRNDKQRLELSLATEIEGLDIHYSFDNSFPDHHYPKYTETLLVPIDANWVRVITYRDGKPIGRMQNMPIEELIKRAPIKKTK